MAANRWYHAGLIVLVLLLLCTFGRCTDLTFGRDGNTITLRCRRNTFPILDTVNFFVRIPGSNTSRALQDFTRVQSNVIMFTLTPETEGYFSCQNPKGRVKYRVKAAYVIINFVMNSARPPRTLDSLRCAVPHPLCAYIDLREPRVERNQKDCSCGRELPSHR